MAQQTWGGIKDCCQYTGRCERTFRQWLKEGLKHSRLPSGRILVRFSDIDEYLQRFQVTESAVGAMVDQLVRDMGRS